MTREPVLLKQQIEETFAILEIWIAVMREGILSDLSLKKNQEKKRSSDYRKKKEEPPIFMSSFVEALPDPIPRFHSPRVSTPLNLTPPDFGDFTRKSYRRDVQTLREEGNERSVTPGINSERSSERMARGGSGSTAKQPFLEVLERCGKLEMENQVPLHSHETYLWAMCLMSMVVLTGAQS